MTVRTKGTKVIKGCRVLELITAPPSPARKQCAVCDKTRCRRPWQLLYIWSVTHILYRGRERRLFDDREVTRRRVSPRVSVSAVRGQPARARLLISKRRLKVERANSRPSGNNKSAGGPPTAPRLLCTPPRVKGKLAILHKSPNETNPWRNRGDGKRWDPRGTRQILIIVKAAAPIKRSLPAPSRRAARDVCSPRASLAPLI